MALQTVYFSPITFRYIRNILNFESFCLNYETVNINLLSLQLNYRVLFIAQQIIIRLYL